MWIKRSDRKQLIGDDIARSEITPQRVFENRRRVLQAAGAVALGSLVGLSDEALAESLVNRAREKDFALRGFVHALVASEAFHSK